MLSLQQVSYILPNKNILFSNINLTLNENDKIALIGNNGTGKSTLLKIIAKELHAASGQIDLHSIPYYVPQIYGQFDHLTIAQALQIEPKLAALKAIMNGDTAEEHYSVLNDDWTIEERCKEALQYWRLNDLSLLQKMGSLSGGQKTKVFLAGIHIHEPSLLLLDEPSNHLDIAGRQLLYDLITRTKSSMVVVSHDRKLLNLLSTTYELTKHGISAYGGNYAFYKEQKQIEEQALNHDILSTEKALRKAKDKERETIERQQKLDSRGKRKQEKAGTARIMMNTLRNNAENSTSKIKTAHTEKIDGITTTLQDLRSTLPNIDQMRFGFNNAALHMGKILFRANNMNFSYHAQALWKENMNIEIVSGDRVALKGRNGSGKTSLIQLILGKLEPSTGSVYRADSRCIYIDQEYTLLNLKLTVYQQAQLFNEQALQEHEIKIRLTRFLFTKEDWDKPCHVLSGGERMRLILCCLTIYSKAPDMIILDEPTNNIDIQNVEILTAAINEYKGTIIAVSHDESFLEQINIERNIAL